MKLFATSIRRILNFFDFFQQRNVIKFFKLKINNKMILVDVGAHHGETIKLFSNNFNIHEIHSFEASHINFQILKKKKFRNNVIINNFAISDQKKIYEMNQFVETSSSTISEININSEYYSKKKRILSPFSSKEIFYKINTQANTLDNYLLKKKIDKVDILKIDTEGHEYKVLLGALKSLKKIKYIYFEHHYNNMVKKNYNFRDINTLLKKNEFKKVFKSKMYFRKVFEYIYENTNI